MKSLHHGTAAANRKLRGKLTLALPCGCCDLRNFKPGYKWLVALREIRQYRRAGSEGEAG